MPIGIPDQAMATLMDLARPIHIRMRGEFLATVNGGIEAFRERRWCRVPHRPRVAGEFIKARRDDRGVLVMVIATQYPQTEGVGGAAR
ncbi:MAG: hypothetical protein J2P54_10280 [Bradyrhizobiaceae bacterium]|nr:hypothetical protein [Bradyrhizobiaceae bacterium]